MSRLGMDSAGAGQDPVTGCCKQDDKISRVVKDRKFVGQGHNGVVDLRQSLNNLNHCIQVFRVVKFIYLLWEKHYKHYVSNNTLFFGVPELRFTKTVCCYTNSVLWARIAQLV